MQSADMPVPSWLPSRKKWFAKGLFSVDAQRRKLNMENTSMSELSDERSPMLLEKFGLTQAGEMNGGVYHLKSVSSDGRVATEYIGLLYSPLPITKQTKSVQLFLQPVPAPLPTDVSPLQIQRLWQNLDARRLEESGLDPIIVDLPADEQWGNLPTVEYARPEKTGRIRFFVQLPTGDVVCYN